MPLALGHSRGSGGKEGQDRKAQTQPEQKRVSIQAEARCTQGQEDAMDSSQGFPNVQGVTISAKNKRNLFYHQGHWKMLNADRQNISLYGYGH